MGGRTPLMHNKLILIFQSIQTAHELDKQFKTFLGWFKFREKREYKQLKKQLIEQINSLNEDRWTVEYLHKLQKSIEAFYLSIKDFFGQELYIPEYDPSQNNSSKIFLPIYFVDQKNKDRLIILEIVSDNITFRIMDTATGNSFTSSSIEEVQSSQKKIESVCKHCLITMIMRYLNNEK